MNQHSPEPGAVTCMACREGYYAAAAGASTCQACPVANLLAESSEDAVSYSSDEGSLCGCLVGSEWRCAQVDARLGSVHPSSLHVADMIPNIASSVVRGA